MSIAPRYGLVGGLGPRAGARAAQTLVNRFCHGDQRSPDVLVSLSSTSIPDRSEWLRTGSGRNPGCAIASELLRLARAGVTHAAVLCNTAHAQPIWQRIEADIQAASECLVLRHYVHDVLDAEPLHHHHRIGLLATLGTHHARIYTGIPQADVTFLAGSHSVQGLVHQAIYDEHWGLKYHGATSRAMLALQTAIEALQRIGADGILLACTELSLISETLQATNTIPVLDSLELWADQFMQKSGEYHATTVHR